MPIQTPLPSGHTPDTHQTHTRHTRCTITFSNMLTPVTSPSLARPQHTPIQHTPIQHTPIQHTHTDTSVYVCTYNILFLHTRFYMYIYTTHTPTCHNRDGPLHLCHIHSRISLHQRSEGWMMMVRTWNRREGGGRGVCEHHTVEEVRRDTCDHHIAHRGV